MQPYDVRITAALIRNELNCYVTKTVNEEEIKMSFGENLQYLRKQKEITQEQLAEQLDVSRQSVSKWESGQSYPEMEKLLQICSMFHCNMDTLMQGDVSRAFAKDTCGYDKFKNTFSRMIAAGTGVLLIGISLMMLLCGIGIDEGIATAVFFALLIVSVLIFVVTGMQGDQFNKKYPMIEDFYTEEEKDRAYRRFTAGIASGVGLILIGLLFVIVADYRLEKLDLMNKAQIEKWEYIIYGIFMLIVAAAASLLTYTGLQKSKYDIEGYNKENNPSPERKKRNELIGKLCGCIMLVATIVFFLIGFINRAWEFSWIAFVVGGILCAVAAIALGREEE